MKDSPNLTEGSIISKLLRVALPLMGTQFMQMAYNITDMFWLGRVGSAAVAAAGTAGLYMWLSLAFLHIGKTGAEIGVSQSFGRGDKKSALVFLQNALFIALILGILFALCMIAFNRALAGFFKFQEKQVSENISLYLFITAFSMPVSFIAMVITGCFNASGNSRTPFLLNAAGLITNLVLDPVFIFVLNWGLKGAAIATVISQCVSGSGMILAVLFSRHRPFERFSFKLKIQLEKIRMIFKWTIPMALEGILFVFFVMLTSRIEASFGAGAVAVSKVSTQIESLSWLISGGFGSALIAFTGQNYGADNRERIRRGVRISALILTVWGVLVTLFLFFGGGFVFSLFFSDRELVHMGIIYLRILAFSQVSLSLEAVGAGAFRGSGYTFPPSFVSIASNMLRPVLAFFLSRTPLGVYGVWIGLSLTAGARGFWVFLWYLRYARSDLRRGRVK